MAAVEVGVPPRFFVYGTLAEISTWLNSPTHSKCIVLHMGTVDKLAANPAVAIWVFMVLMPTDPA